MNKKQKIVLYIATLIIIITFIIWLINGGEIFTKTQILVETKNELFGWTEKKWLNRFIWGLDLSLLISIITILISGLLLYLLRKKN